MSGVPQGSPIYVATPVLNIAYIYPKSYLPDNGKNDLQGRRISFFSGSSNNSDVSGVETELQRIRAKLAAARKKLGYLQAENQTNYVGMRHSLALLDRTRLDLGNSRLELTKVQQTLLNTQYQLQGARQEIRSKNFMIQKMQEEFDDQNIMFENFHPNVEYLKKELLDSEREKQFYKTMYEQSLRKEKSELNHSINPKHRKGFLRSHSEPLIQKRRV